MTTRIHDMYRLLQECGEDTTCGCGCTSEKKRKWPAKLENLSGADRVVQALTEFRSRIGLRQFRHIRRVAEVRSGRASKVIAGRKMKHPVRRGAVHNRHR